MGKGKKNKGKKSSSYQVKLNVETGEIDFMAHAFINGTIKISSTGLDNVKSDNLAEKLSTLIQEYLKRNNPDIKYAADIKFRTSKREDEEFLTRYSLRLAKEQEAREEDSHEYIGELVKGVGKKIVLFKYPVLKEEWRLQRDIWNSWKEFIRVFLDDSMDGEEVELEQGDVVGEYKIPEELEIRKKLLRDYPDDSEKLGFQKLKKEPQT